MSTSKLFLMRIAKSKNDSQYFVLMPAAFTNDSLYKYKSSYIGKYIKRTIFPIHYNDSTLYATLYAIEPLKSALITQATKGDTLPAGYEYIDDNLYGLPNNFEPKESTKFYDFR
ncbi:hypothetical protein FPZ43_15710 [Mucilaginibacter pallidiroseus]|uniref:Uncharacterized protein n=1 Tax=Mucilaginibacter pallidiroseus TaxID=2599295 RepID=A0A563U302_9SPHI|nr:hypothetical protein [Mucilaginibacter pallidiroseus]TWR25731.1 hypothetical protein FPZ43_15710 [Mucilaginibacter pallidiroseus]